MESDAYDEFMRRDRYRETREKYRDFARVRHDGDPGVKNLDGSLNYEGMKDNVLRCMERTLKSSVVAYCRTCMRETLQGNEDPRWNRYCLICLTKEQPYQVDTIVRDDE